MSEVPPLIAAIGHMSAHEGLTDFSSWKAMHKDGTWIWNASVKIDERACHVGQGADPITALLAALGAAYADRPNRKGPL